MGGGSYLGDGIQADGSFHQHGAQLLDGAYGVGLTDSIAGFLPVSEGLEWACPAAGLAVFAELVLQGQLDFEAQRVGFAFQRGAATFSSFWDHFSRLSSSAHPLLSACRGLHVAHADL